MHLHKMKLIFAHAQPKAEERKAMTLVRYFRGSFWKSSRAKPQKTRQEQNSHSVDQDTTLLCLDPKSKNFWIPKARPRLFKVTLIGLTVKPINHTSCHAAWKACVPAPYQGRQLIPWQRGYSVSHQPQEEG